MSISRRQVLTVVGGGVIVAAGGGAAWVATREPTRATRPWLEAGAGETELRRRALSYAILAPNPHNRQPWRVTLVGREEIVLTCDPDRRLPVTDPEDRQITIGLGCFLELLRMAAPEAGARADIDLFPDGAPFPRLDGRPVAHIRLVADAGVAPDPLFKHVLARRSNKEAYDVARPVLARDLETLKAAVRFGSRAAATNVAAEVAGFRELAADGMRTELTTPRALEESLRLTRIGKREIEANPDGVDLGGAFFEALSGLGLLSREDMTDTTSSTFTQMRDAMLAPMATAMAYFWLVTPDNKRADQIAAGRDYVRVNLAATALGLGIHPQSQTLQEFAEMRPLFGRMRDMAGAAGRERVQMFCRLGYGPQVKPSPRWPAASRIFEA